MYAPGSFQQQQQGGYTSCEAQTQSQTVIYPSIVDEKQVVQSLNQPLVDNSPYNIQQPGSLQYAAPTPSSLYPPEKTSSVEPQSSSAYGYPAQHSYISTQSTGSFYPPEKIHYELYTEPHQQPGPAFPAGGAPYTSPLPPGVYPPEKTHFELITQPTLPPSYPPSISEKSIYDAVPQPLIPPPPYASPAPCVGTGAGFYPQQSVQQGVQQGYQTEAYAPVPDPLIYTPPPSKPKDEKKSGTAKRFLGDTLVGRFARSAVHTTTSTARLVTYLSPWGDNNSVTLPNVRYRDAALFATFSVIGGPLLEGTGDLIGGAVGDTFAATVIDPMTDFFVNNLVAKYALFQIIEQAIDKGILEHMFPEQEKMLKTTSMRTLQCAVKHKLMDVDANIQLFYPSESMNPGSIEKGWFCPYFYASNRTPKIARQQDFGIAQFFGPFLRGDHQLAEKLLSESNSVISLCDPDPTHDTHTRRLLVTFVGITPYRAGMWSTSRRPGVSLINYHLLNGCPALVIPVNENCPISAWSPVTLNSITIPGFDPAPLHGMICEFLDGLVRMEGVLPKLRERYDEVLSRCVSMVVNGAVGLRDAEVPREVIKKLDAERAGIAFFRY